ncbi:Hypothetical protein KNT65_gp111 [Escherichia phage EcS1]|uniref:Uncharacterized protein n=1 Tax=Escherichia phage EcS1 TaxID=2083276 RepID=A0A2Z5ZC20_9CAUD|nr:Hypothetical protein KNT65_gp111 [Escherichia phage EcS1]BBC78159.1 Hypothetical protein [Escherichia phage EcS1]
MTTKIHVGDFILSRQYNNKMLVEVCQYEGATGSLMYGMNQPNVHYLERFVKQTESLPYCMTIVRKDSEGYNNILEAIKANDPEYNLL